MMKCQWCSNEIELGEEAVELFHGAVFRNKKTGDLIVDYANETEGRVNLHPECVCEFIISNVDDGFMTELEEMTNGVCQACGCEIDSVCYDCSEKLLGDDG